MNKSVAAFCANESEPNAALTKLVKAAQARGVAVFAYSALNEIDSSALLTRLGLDELGGTHSTRRSTWKPSHEPTTGSRCSNKLESKNKTIVAVVSSQLACKGALTAGASVIAVPDQYTDFQDFSGAAFVLDQLSDKKPDELLDHTLRM